MTQKMTKRSKAAAAKARAATRAARNPLTGGAPNTFTAVSGGRELGAPSTPHPYSPHRMDDPSGAVVKKSGNPKQVPNARKNAAEARRLQAAHVAATTGPESKVDAPVGYRVPAVTSAPKPRQDARDARFPDDQQHAASAWLVGAHHMLPNEGASAGNPAINEPHDHSPGVAAQRRAEDLSGPEYRKATGVLAHFGHDPKDPVASLVDTTTRSMHRTFAEHVAAGVNESASQMFYGGHPTTKIDNPELAREHRSGVMAASDKLDEHTGAVMDHPKFQEAFGHLSGIEQMDHARRMVASATADTSPNSKYLDPKGKTEASRWPNLSQARESVDAALDGRAPRFITGRTPNEVKATGRVDHMIETKSSEIHQYGDPKTAAKTVAFRGALADKEHTDAYNVTDVHDAGQAFPGLDTAKSKVGNAPGVGRTTVYPDMKEPKGFRQEWKVTSTGDGNEARKPVKGLSRGEQALAAGTGTVHALRDYAGRQARASLGVSRSPAHTDNTHAAQAMLWGAQQVVRPDVQTSHADNYPVVRDWAAEGGSLGEKPKWQSGSTTDWMYEDKSAGQQWRRNPNTDFTRPPTRKAYPALPGD